MNRSFGYAFLLLGVILLMSSLSYPTPAFEPTEDSGYQILFDAREAHGPSKVTLQELDDDSGYDVWHYNVEIRFSHTDESVNGHVDMFIECTFATLSQVAMHLQSNMTVDGVWVDNVSTTYTQTNPDGLLLSFVLKIELLCIFWVMLMVGVSPAAKS